MMQTWISKLPDLKKWTFSTLAAGRLSDFSFLPGKYRPILILLVITLLTCQLSGIMYKIVGVGLIGPKAAQTGKEDLAPIKPVAREPVASYKAVLERNLFESTDKIFGEVSPQVQEAPPLSSILELHGTVAGEGKYGFAVILEKGKNKQVLVKIGNQIAGATLLKVARDQVSLKYQGKEETLKRIGATEVPLLQGGTKSPALAGMGTAPVKGTVSLSRQEINTSINDLGQMLNQAQIRPNFSAGVQDGFIISQIRPGSLFQRMGLVEGDIIQGLDNRPFQSAEDMMSLFNTLRSAPGMNLTIKRAGKPEKINYLFN